MAKVAFGFKAQDGKRDIIKRIEAFGKEHGYEFRKITYSDDEVKQVYLVDSKQNKLMFVLDARVVYKVNLGIWIYLEPFELKFIDNLDFNLDNEFIEDTGQDVTDWFTK